MGKMKGIKYKWELFVFGWYVILMYYRAWFCRWQIVGTVYTAPVKTEEGFSIYGPDRVIDYNGHLSSWRMMDFFINYGQK